jgi:DNA-binding MarR family transcriptional regulator
VVGLVNRAEAAGLVTRWADPDDQRMVRLSLTKAGAKRLAKLAAANLEELRRLTPRLRALWTDLDVVPASSAASAR